MPPLRLLGLAALLASAVACDDTFNYNKSPHGGGGGGDDSGGRYHPAGWAEPGAHGLAAKLHDETCTDCHGAALEGAGVALSCDSCHAEGWRTDCTFCHGGVDDETGAPPEDIDDSTSSVSFPPHHRHVTENTHAAFDCETCHVKPTDVLSPGHLFDDTPAVAEVDLSAGLSDQGQWSGQGCSDLYCHGGGRRDDGQVALSDAPLSCESCHPGPSSGRSAWATMSGEHEDHLREGLSCDDCHQDTTADARSIRTPALHVNGVADFAPDTSYIQRSGDTCTGTCHGESHDREDW
ncbi:MAG: hypothetical protein H6740_24595 [Alphaproteobacteria bacterium]|nr:hypothetical protein [Alphaproteobacteria bacterium]